MPQFDIILYLTYFINFVFYLFILYLMLTLFLIPFFWNIYYFRYIKKEINSFLFDIFFKKLKNFRFLFLFLQFLTVNSIILINIKNYILHIIYNNKLIKIFKQIF